MGRRARVTREDVLTAARAAFSERGFEGTTLAGIAGRLGLSPAALLRHARTKEELFAAAMADGAGTEPLPMAFLAGLDGTEDPRTVLRRLARVFVPFLEGKLGQVIALYLRAQTSDAIGGMPLPFDPTSPQSPPRRFLALLEGYFERARRAGRLDVADPCAAAFAFIGALHSYVFLHRVAKVLDPPLPLDRYLDALLAIWTRGAIRAREPAPGRARSRR